MPRKSIYFPEHLVKEMEAEAVRQGRPRSWIAQVAWGLAREKMQSFPADPLAAVLAKKE